jgi:hypothetical protein
MYSLVLLENIQFLLHTCPNINNGFELVFDFCEKQVLIKYAYTSILIKN